MIKPARGPRDLSLSPRRPHKVFEDSAHVRKASAYHLHIRVTQITEVESGAHCLVRWRGAGAEGGLMKTCQTIWSSDGFSDGDDGRVSRNA